MSLKVFISGDRFSDVAGEIEKDLLGPALEAVGEAAEKVGGRMRQKLSRVATSKREHAAPGEPPLDQPPAGQGLVASVKVRPAKASASGTVVSAEIRVEDDGANGLEYGFTDAKGRVHQPHPFYRPSLEELAPEIEAALSGLEPKS